MSGLFRPLGHRLFARLTVAFACCLVVSFALAAALTVMPLRHSIWKETRKDLKRTADEILARIDGYAIERCDDVRLWASLMPRPVGVATPLEPFLARLTAGSPEPWRLLAVVDREGVVVATSSPGPRAGGVAGDPGSRAGSPGGCALAFQGGANPSLVVTPPADAAGMRLVGVLDLAPLRGLVREVPFEELPQGSDAFIVLLGEGGEPLIEPETYPSDPRVVLGAAVQDYGTDVSDVGLGDAGRYLVAQGTAAPGSITDPSLHLVAFRSAGAAMAASSLHVGRILHAAAVGLLLAIGLSFLIARDLSTRLARLIEGARGLAAGGGPHETMDDGSHDEIGDLARAFDCMAEDIARVRSELEGSVAHRTAELRQKSEALHHALQETEAAGRAKSQFLANVSHEIRTPLNGIIGMTALALDAELTPDVRAHLTHVKASADALLGLVNDILDFSRIETRRLRLDPIPFRMRAGLEDIVRDFAARASEKGLAVGCRVDDGVPDELVGDPARLRQVLVSLLGNAVKFTERGRIDLTVALEDQAAEGLTLRFTVTDTGIGIPADQQAHIFQPFTQVDGSSTRKHGGAGLGLALATQLVDLMRGRIWVESAEGRGSAFHFTARFRAVRGAGALAGTDEPLPAVRALVVDDNVINRRLLETRLKTWGLKMESAADGARALDMLRAAAAGGDPYAVAIVDMQMPELDGFGLAERVKAEPALQSTRILMLTSAGQRGDAARCRAIGLEGYLTKPARESDLRDALQAILRGAPMPASLVTRHALREGRPPLPATISGSEASGPLQKMPAPEAPIDPADLLGRVEGDRALLSELVRTFLETAPEQLAQIDQALDRGEGAALIRAAHAIKGCVGTFGALPALRAAARLEACIDRGDIESARRARQELAAEMTRLTGALSSFVKGNG